MDHPKCSVHQSLNNVSYDTFLIKKYMFKHIYRRNCAAITIHTDTRSTKCIIININIYQQQIAICKVLDAHAYYMQAASRYPNHCNSLAPGGLKKQVDGLGGLAFSHQSSSLVSRHKQTSWRKDESSRDVNGLLIMWACYLPVADLGFSTW